MAHRRHAARDRLHVVDVADIEALEAMHARVAARPGDVWEDKLDVLRRCLDELPEPQREVLRLYYWDGLNCHAIATKLGR